MSKPRSLTQYKKLDKSVKEQIKLQYPYGFDKQLVTLKDKGGKFIYALPFETETVYYLIKMTKREAQKLFLQETANEEFDAVVDIVKDDDLKIEEIPSEEAKVEVSE